MKKTYIIPEALVVNLSMCSIIAVSGEGLQTNDKAARENAEGLAKESAGTSGTNVWDEEW